jgi:hypothetical protein
VHGFVEAVGAAAARRAPAVSIGPVTSEAARDAGLEVAAEADEATIPALVAAAARLLDGGGPGDDPAATAAGAGRVAVGAVPGAGR